MARIVILSGIQVIDNPRVVKEADALAEAGHDVEVLGSIYNEPSRVRIDGLLRGRRWRHTAVADLTSPSLRKRAEGVMMRARWRLARLLKDRASLELPDQLGMVVRPLYRVARSKPADLYIAHLEQALWAGNRLIDLGRHVAVDIEDWYSEDGLPEDQARRPVALIKRLELGLFRRATYATTTSLSLAEALARAYGIPAPSVIHNSFPSEEREWIDHQRLDRKSPGALSIVWFSQRTGPGRGLEDLVKALPTLDGSFELHIRGTPRDGYAQTLTQDAPLGVRERIYFHPQVPQHQLLSRLAEHDIGYCGEQSDCLSRDLTITNKVFEYMRAGLAIVASDTSGQREVAAAAPGSVRLFPQGDVASLGRRLQAWLSDREALSVAKAASLDALRTRFDWTFSKRQIQSLARPCGQASCGRPRVA